MNTQIGRFRAHLLPFLAFVIALSPVAADDETPLEKEMAKINSGYKLLGRQAQTGSYDFEALGKAFAEAKVAAEAAAGLVPAKVAKIQDEGIKKKAIARFRKEIGKLTKELAAIGGLCQAKDGKKLSAAYENLKKTKKRGHDRFIEE